MFKLATSRLAQIGEIPQPKSIISHSAVNPQRPCRSPPAFERGTKQSALTWFSSNVQTNNAEGETDKTNISKTTHLE